ncbi:MAG: hypothetical protein JEZ07_11460 [Phycisphaerae bacterium]|nr:hypothetical protein [Phycisphaerae bacterium]
MFNYQRLVTVNLLSGAIFAVVLTFALATENLYGQFGGLNERNAVQGISNELQGGSSSKASGLSNRPNNMNPQQTAQQASQKAANILASVLDRTVLSGKSVDPNTVSYVNDMVTGLTRDEQKVINNDPVAKVNIDLAEAYMAYFAGQDDDLDKKISSIKSSLKRANYDKNGSDALVYLYYIRKDYKNLGDYLGQLVRAKASVEAGSDALLQAKLSLDSYKGIDSSAASDRNARGNNNRGGMDMGMGMPGMGMPGGMGMGMPGGFGAATKSALNLQIGYMPVESLGLKVPMMNLVDMNGCRFNYNPGNGNMLAMLLWTLPPKSKVQGGPNSMMGMGMPGMGFNNRGAKVKANAVKPTVLDLDGNVNQFRELYVQAAKHGILGSVKFVAVNCNEVQQLGDVVDVLSKQSWPFINCMRNATENKAFFDSLGKEFQTASPIMVLVGVEGDICYAGPVGGALAFNCMAREAQGISLAGGGLDMSGAEQAIATGMLEMMGNMMKASGQNMSEADQAKVAQAVKGGQAVTATETKKEVKVKEVDDVDAVIANHEATQWLSMAETKMRVLSFNIAMDWCDKVLEKYPDSAEADKAKELIRKCLDKRPMYKNSRKNKKLYIGE